MEQAAAPKETATARPGIWQSAGCSVISMALGECLRKAIHMLFKAVARFRRLLDALARQPALVLWAIFRAPLSLANLVRLLLTSRPASLLFAAAASIICITLQYHRPTVGDIQLSSSISLLFGMIKFQGSLALQLGPPEARKSVDQEQPEELRIKCPKDLKDSIVRFLESQAAANHAMQTPATPWQLSPNREHVEGRDSRLHQQCHHLEEQQDSPEAEEREASLYGLTTYDAFTFTTISPDPLAPAAGGYPEGIIADAAAGEAFTVREFMSYGSAGSAAGGFESCSSDTCLETTTATRTTSSDAVGAGAAAGAEKFVPSLEALLPSTPPLGCSPPAKTGVCLALSGGVEPQGAKPLEALEAAAPLEHSRYLSHVHNASPSKPSIAPALAEAQQQEVMMTHGPSPSGCYGTAHETTWSDGVSEAEEVAEAAAMATATTLGRLSPAVGGRRIGALQKSPDSILGLRKLGLEGWTENSRQWESQYLED